jgi:hypothetical protein
MHILAIDNIKTIIFITIGTGGDSENVASIFTIYFRDLLIVDTGFKNRDRAQQKNGKQIKTLVCPAIIPSMLFQNGYNYITNSPSKILYIGC